MYLLYFPRSHVQLNPVNTRVSLFSEHLNFCSALFTTAVDWYVEQFDDSDTLLNTVFVVKTAELDQNSDYWRSTWSPLLNPIA